MRIKGSNTLIKVTDTCMKSCNLKPCKGDIFVAGGSAPGIKRSGDPRCANVHGIREKHSRTERYRSLQEFPHSGESMIISLIKEQDTPEKETSLKTGGDAPGYPYLALTGPFQLLIRINY